MLDLFPVAIPQNILLLIVKKKNDPDGTRTHNPQLRRLMPYPLGHRVPASATQLITAKT